MSGFILKKSSIMSYEDDSTLSLQQIRQQMDYLLLFQNHASAYFIDVHLMCTLNEVQIVLENNYRQIVWNLSLISNVNIM